MRGVIQIGEGVIQIGEGVIKEKPLLCLLSFP